jgi:hypothetical protein
MDTDIEFNAAFKRLQSEFKHKSKRTFLEEVKIALEDRHDFVELITQRQEDRKFVAVTFDRRRNDKVFSYVYFDLLLVLLDRLSGGGGIYKPVNQVRAVQWNANRSDLIQILRYFALHFPKVNSRRLLVLPFPEPPVGFQIDSNIHRK